MAGSATITGTQNYILGIGHPKTEATTEAPPAVFETDPVTGGQGLIGFGALNNPYGLAILGDSYCANAQVYTSTTRRGELAQGIHVAINAALGGPWDVVYDGSVSGTTTADWIANQLPGVLASNAFTVFVGHPTNDPAGLSGTADQVYAASIANLANIYAQIKQAGKSIVVANCGNKAGWTGAQRGIALAISDWITAQAIGAGWPILDVLGATWDASTGKGSTAFYLSESATYTHPAPAGSLAAARFSLNNFARIPSRPCNSQNAPSQGVYNTAFNGDTSGFPDMWSTYTAGTPTGTSVAKVARTDSARSLVRFVGTSDAAGSRVGMTSIQINFTASWTAAVHVLGRRIRGSFGDHWVCTTAGASTGSQPAAMAAASSVGDTVTDSGGVVWTRYKNIVPGTSYITLRLEFDVTTVSGGDLGFTPGIICNFLPATGAFSVLGNTVGASSDQAQRWDFTKTRRPVICTPRFLIPADKTSMTLFVFGQWSAASVTSTFDVYGLEARID